MAAKQFTLIGSDLYFHGYKVAVVLPNLPPTVQADLEDYIHPRHDLPPKKVRR